jgi:hypothetical protein
MYPNIEIYINVLNAEKSVKPASIFLVRRIIFLLLMPYLCISSNEVQFASWTVVVDLCDKILMELK